MFTRYQVWTAYAQGRVPADKRTSSGQAEWDVMESEHLDEASAVAEAKEHLKTENVEMTYVLRSEPVWSSPSPNPEAEKDIDRLMATEGATGDAQ